MSGVTRRSVDASGHVPFELPRGPWQDLRSGAVHTPVHTAIARALFHRVVPSLAVRVELPDGRVIGGGGSRRPAHARAQRRLLPPARDRRAHRVRRGVHGRRLGRRRSRRGAHTVRGADVDTLVPAWMQRLRHFYVRHQPSLGAQHQDRRPRATSQRHYDLSNELFALFLDETMTYSCARFEPAPDESLADAQRRKVDPLLDATGVGLGQPACSRSAPAGARSRCGPRSAARPSPRSRSRRSRRRSRASGRSDARRRRRGSTCSCATTATSRAAYDAIVSVEMIEAVGAEYWPIYFAHPRPRARAGRPDRGAGDPARSTTACWRRSTSTRGSASTSSPGARCRRCAPSRRPCGDHTRCASTQRRRVRRRLRAHAAGLARAVRRARRARSTRSGSTPPSGACGTSTSRTARPASPPATSTSPRSCCRARRSR